MSGISEKREQGAAGTDVQGAMGVVTVVTKKPAVQTSKSTLRIPALPQERKAN